MNSNELSEAIADIVSNAQARIIGIGEQNYGGPEQHFEMVPMLELYGYAEEELLDLINYSVMIIIRLRRLAAKLMEAEVE